EYARNIGWNVDLSHFDPQSSVGVTPEKLSPYQPQEVVPHKQTREVIIPMEGRPSLGEEVTLEEIASCGVTDAIKMSLVTRKAVEKAQRANLPTDPNKIMVVD
ncbi:hypothetical protein Ancab_018857, partial [Ancistrocladus abbreviatus]